MTASTSTMQAIAIPGVGRPVRPDAHELEMEAQPREGMQLVGLLLEVVVGVWLMSLFLLALAWDPIDRRIGTRGKRIAARIAARPATSAGTRDSSGAYAILPAE